MGHVALEATALAVLVCASLLWLAASLSVRLQLYLWPFGLGFPEV